MCIPADLHVAYYGARAFNMEEQVLLIISRVEADNSLDKLYEINAHSPGNSE